MKTMKLIMLTFTLFFLKSCGNTKEIASTQDKDNTQNTEVLSGSYLITKLGTNIDFPVEITLEFDAKTNKVSGFSGCNQFMGTFTSEANTIGCSQLIATEMMCKPEIDELERSFRKHLTAATTFDLRNDVLILKNNTEDVIHGKKKKSGITFIYEQMTRGFYEKIWIDQNSITFSNDRALKETKTSDCTKEDWERLLTYFKSIDINSISELEAPTKMHQYDGAAMATLKIEIDDESYQTNIFDHGHPPGIIAELVNKLLSMKKMMEKE